MKTLQTFAASNNLRIVPITYRTSGIRLKRKGYDLIRNENEILISFEPMSLTGSKWFIRNSYKGYEGKIYLERITPAFLASLDINAPVFNRLK